MSESAYSARVAEIRRANLRKKCGEWPEAATVFNPQLVKRILAGYVLSPMGIHGLSHWARVLEIGSRLTEQTGADLAVVELFAIFHDSRRVNDGSDPDHGRRGAALAGEYFDELGLSVEQFELLDDACSYHTDGLTEGEVTVQTCWDSDRLDLWRVGIRPRPDKLCTAAALDYDLQRWARERSESDHVPVFVSAEWLKART